MFHQQKACGLKSSKVRFEFTDDVELLSDTNIFHYRDKLTSVFDTQLCYFSELTV